MNFSRRKITFSPAARCKISLKNGKRKSKLTTVEVEASLFKIKASGSFSFYEVTSVDIVTLLAVTSFVVAYSLSSLWNIPLPANRNDSRMHHRHRLDLDTSIQRETNCSYTRASVRYAPITRDNKIHFMLSQKGEDSRMLRSRSSSFFLPLFSCLLCLFLSFSPTRSILGNSSQSPVGNYRFRNSRRSRTRRACIRTLAS